MKHDRPRKRARLVAAVSVPVMLATSMYFAGPASAGAGDVVNNPGPGTFVASGGGFLTLAGRNTVLPSTATPTQCNDGINNDVAVDDPTKSQDANIDFDGGASHGVSPATPVDVQCAGALDDSEIALGNQPRGYITNVGTVDKDGNLVIPQGGFTFPKSYVYAATGGAITIVPTATSAAIGTLNPATGVLNLHVNWKFELQQAFFHIDCAAPISMDLSSSPLDSTNSGPIPVAPVAYNTSTGSVTVSSNTFSVPAMTPVGVVSRATGSATAASTTFTDSSAPFKATDVGRSVTIFGAGTAGADLVAQIKTFTSTTSVVLNVPAVTTVSPATWTLADSSQQLCDSVNTGFGLPAAAGVNANQLSFNSSTVFIPGAVVANNDTGTTTANTPLVVAAAGVLSNDTGSGNHVTGHTNPTHGSVSIAANGGYTYTPSTNYTGSDSFTYTVTDGFTHTATGTVNLTVNLPAAPVATNDGYTTPYQTALNVSAPGVLGNDSGMSLTVQTWGTASHGTVSGNSDGSFTYTPNAGYAGSDSFTYTATDPFSRTSGATVNLTVSNPSGPVANTDSYSTGYETALNVAAPGVLGNDSGTGLTVQTWGSASHGTVSGNSDGSFTYTPNAGYAGSDSFTYTATDPFSQTASATINITVNNPAAPVAAGDTYGTPYQTALNVSAPGVLGNDSGTNITVQTWGTASHGSVSGNSDGSFTYTPDSGYGGPDSFSYTATDPFGQTSNATVNLTVGLPAGPSTTNDTYSTGYNTPVTVAAPGVLGNDSGTGITVTSFTQGANSTVTVNADGSFTFTPKASIAGPLNFTYTVTDSFARTSTASVRVNVAFPTKPASCVNTWQLNGNAAKGALCEAVLTPAKTQQAGTAFFPVAQPSLNIRKISFDVVMGTGTGGDGVILYFGDASTGATATSVGQYGGYLGVGGDALHAIPGVGVALDTHQNGGDVSNNFVAFNKGSNLLGAVPGLKYTAQANLASIPLTSASVKVTNHVVVTIQGGRVTSVAINGTTVLTGSLYLPPSVLIGFGSSTGGFTDFHSVKNVVTTIN
jgi:hypothetical protein